MRLHRLVPSVALIIAALVGLLLWWLLAQPQRRPYSGQSTGVGYVRTRNNNKADRVIVFEFQNGGDRWLSFKPINIRLQAQDGTNWQKISLKGQRTIRVAPHYAQTFTFTAPEGDVRWAAVFECLSTQPRSLKKVLHDWWLMLQRKPREEGAFEAFLGTPYMDGLQPQVRKNTNPQ